MTLETIFRLIIEYKLPITIGIFVAPFLAWFICWIIPGRREESFVLSVNMALALFSLVMWVGYLIYALNSGGLIRIVEADLFLFLAPPYYMTASILLSRRRMPLDEIPAYRAFQGLTILVIIFLILSWIFNRIRIIFFSYLPLGYFLGLILILLVIGYLGLRRLTGKK